MNIDKTKLSWQLVVLSCICLFPMGAYFVYDAPATLMRYFKAALEMNQSEYMSYYTWYSAPNIVFCIAAGVLVDNVFGRRLSGIIFCTCVFLGQTLFTFGMSKTPDSKSWAYLSKIGRTIIGIGVESIAVTSKVYITWWYKDTPLYSIAFAICIAFWRVSSSFSLMTMLPYYNNHNSVVPNDGSTLEFNIFTCQGCEKTEKAFLNQEIGEAYQEDTMYYCYDQQVLDSCMMVTSEQINHWNVHNATNLSRTKACSQFDEATQQFLNASGLIQHGCFDPKTFVFNLEKCHCLDSQYVPVENAWEWADSMASQYEIESDKFTSAKIDSLRDPFYWSSGFGEYLTGDDLADKIEYFSLLNYQYCADKQDISLEFGRYSAEEGWSVGDFVKGEDGHFVGS